MAKLNKIMPPRNTKIRGQDHLLAYITPEEAALLKARGGSGEAGPMGIPSYPHGGGPGGSGGSSGSGGSGGSSGGGSGGSSGSGGSGGSSGGGGGRDDDNNDGGMPGDDTGQGSSSGSYGGGGGGGMNEGQDNTGIADALGYSGGGGSSNDAVSNALDAINDMISANAVANALDAAKSVDIGDYAASDLSTDLADVLGVDNRDRATEKDYGTQDPTAEQIEQARGFDFGSDASDALIAQIQGGYGGKILGDQYAGSGFENQMFFDQLPQRLANAESLPGLLGVGSTYMLNKMKDQVLAGGLPAFNAAVPSGGLTGYGDRKFQGVFSKGPFGYDVYTGMPIEGNKLTGWSPDDNGRGTEEEIKPLDPETGQCEEGYMFDEDMQACRLDTRSSMGGQPRLPRVPFAPGGYARMGLLDEAPTNLPQFQQRYGAGFGTPSEFAAANRAFRQQGAYRPEYFKRPYPTDGYTLLG